MHLNIWPVVIRLFLAFLSIYPFDSKLHLVYLALNTGCICTWLKMHSCGMNFKQIIYSNLCVFMLHLFPVILRWNVSYAFPTGFIITILYCIAFYQFNKLLTLCILTVLSSSMHANLAQIGPCSTTVSDFMGRSSLLRFHPCPLLVLLSVTNSYVC